MYIYCSSNKINVTVHRYFSIQCINKQKRTTYIISRLSAENPEPAYKTKPRHLRDLDLWKKRMTVGMRVFLIRNIKTDCHETYEEDWKLWENPVQKISLKMALIKTYNNRILQPNSSTSIVFTFFLFFLRFFPHW